MEKTLANYYRLQYPEYKKNLQPNNQNTNSPIFKLYKGFE